MKAKKATQPAENRIAVNCVQWNLNPEFEKVFVTVDDKGRISLYELNEKNNPVLCAQEPTANGLNTVAIERRSGNLLLCGGIDTKLSLFDINMSRSKKESTKPIKYNREMVGHRSLITSCGFLNTSYFISGSRDSTINLWEADQQRAITKWVDHQDEVVALDVFEMDGNIFVSGSADLTFRVWDIRMKRACFRVFEKNRNHVSAVRFMPENVNTIAVGYDDASIKIWDLRAIGKISKMTEKNAFESVISMEFSKSGRLLFAAYNNTTVKVWDLLTGQKNTEFGGNFHEDGLKSISLAENGSSLITTGKDGLIAKWDLQ